MKADLVGFLLSSNVCREVLVDEEGCVDFEGSRMEVVVFLKSWCWTGRFMWRGLVSEEDTLPVCSQRQ